MKKTSILALALMAAFALASCNRQEIDPPQEGTQGKYLLTEITASTGEDDTKTSYQSSGVVNWDGEDQIAVKGTDGALHYYEIKYGAGTPVGKFLPAPGQTPASYNQLSDLTAIYPACAAELSGGELYVNINNQDLSGSFADKGLRSWGELSPFYFSNNDIKVAVASRTTLDGGGKLNFKFKQLGTRCEFILDFTQADIAPSLMKEKMERFQLTTLEGRPIAGRAKVSGVGLGTITTPQSICDISFPIAKSLSSKVSVVSVLYPVVTTNTTLKITVTTTEHEFIFTGKPTQDFESGKSLTLPITVDKNFTVGGLQLAYTSAPRAGTEPFYYYGGTNCLLLASTHEVGSLDVTQYVTDSYWHDTKNTAEVLTQKPAAYAKIIWSEGSDVIANDMVDATNGYKLKLAGSLPGSADAISTDANGKSTLTIQRGGADGNALVGIYDSSNTLLWSYHIWCPHDDPTAGMYEFNKTNSGTYTVMTMPIGARVKASLGMSEPENAVGLLYQWGRKDPMGRPTSFSLSAGGDALTVLGSDQSSALNIGDPANQIAGGNLKDCEIWFSNSDYADRNVLKDAWDVPVKTKTLFRYILDYTISKPWMFIMCRDKDFCHSWIPLDSSYLWGNGDDPTQFYIQEECYKSIFDPSPAGFRVAPQDLWIITTKNHDSADASSAADKDAYKTNNFNVVSNTMSRGYTFYYQDWKTGPSAYFISTGFRNGGTGLFGMLGSALTFWTSSTSRFKEGYAARFYATADMISPMTDQECAHGFCVYSVKEY